MQLAAIRCRCRVVADIISGDELRCLALSQSQSFFCFLVDSHYLMRYPTLYHSDADQSYGSKIQPSRKAAGPGRGSSLSSDHQSPNKGFDLPTFNLVSGFVFILVWNNPNNEGGSPEKKGLRETLERAAAEPWKRKSSCEAGGGDWVWGEL
jgi:hypothetical protein